MLAIRNEGIVLPMCQRPFIWWGKLQHSS